MRFLHAADFHLDSAFGALSPQQALQRRQEGRDLLMALAHYVNETHIDLVLLAGDLFDATQSFSQTSTALSQAFAHMNAQIVIAPGNHDFCSPNSPYHQVSWPDNVHIFKHATMETLLFPQWNVSVSGAGFTKAEQTQSLLSGWTAPQDGSIHFGVLHGEIQPTQPRYNPLSKEDIAQSGLAYLALGHIHKASEPVRYGQTLCAFSGCLEGHGFDELGEKGFLTGELSPQGDISVHFVPFARRRHEHLSVNITGQHPLDAIQQALPPDTASHLYRIDLTGETDVQGLNLPAIHQTLAPRFFALSIRDCTTIAQNIWDKTGEDSLSGLFLQTLHQQLSQATTQEDRQTILLAARYGLAALERRDML